jgi:CRP-like cAMP-binding protein/anti-anti-sigma regulatory factor
MLLDLAVIALVAILSVTVNIVLAVFIGIVIAVVLFVARMSRTSIRRTYRCDTVRSRRARGRKQVALLEQHGGKILVIELQGVLFFGSAERLSETIERAADADTQSVILDLRRVTEIDATGTWILSDIQLALAHSGQTLVLARAEHSEVATRLAEAGVVDAIGAEHIFADVDRAMEWAEDDLLRDATDDETTVALPLAAVDFCAELTAAEVATLEGYLEQRQYSAGNLVFAEGDCGKELFIITRGRASAWLKQPSGGDIRLATFSPGTVFGELAILDAGPRSASVSAEADLSCYLLSEAKFAELTADAPQIAVRLLQNLSRALSGRLRRANRTIHQLES